MILKLQIDGKEKSFSYNFVSGRALRETAKINKLFNSLSDDPANFDDDAIDVLADYVVLVYANQFTRDEFYDGIDAREIIPTVIKLMEKISGQLNNSAPQKKTGKK